MMTIKQRLKLNQNTFRKTVMLLMTLTLVVTSIGAAAAKPKPGKSDKPDEPVYYKVTMELVEEGDKFLDGLSTKEEECLQDADPDADRFVLRLEESRSGSLLATADGAFPSDPITSDPDLYLNAIYFGNGSVTGCYQGTRPTESEPTESGADFFRMVFDRDGALEKITWHFDVVTNGAPVTQAPVTHKYALTSQTKKGRNAAQVKWEGKLAEGPTSGIVTGSFELWNYTNADDGSVWKLIGTSELKFDLSIELWIEPES